GGCARVVDCLRAFPARRSSDLLERFENVLRRLTEAGLRPPLVHAANSPATLALPQGHYNMVRNGLAVYGLYPSPSTRRAAEAARSEEHTSELQSRENLVCRLLH